MWVHKLLSLEAALPRGSTMELKGEIFWSFIANVPKTEIFQNQMWADKGKVEYFICKERQRFTFNTNIKLYSATISTIQIEKKMQYFTSNDKVYELWDTSSYKMFFLISFFSYCYSDWYRIGCNLRARWNLSWERTYLIVREWIFTLTQPLLSWSVRFLFLNLI